MIETQASKRFTEGRHSCRLGREGRKTIPATRVSPFLWLNLVCLDAPVVAVSWQWMFARSFGIEVAPGATVALFLTAWLIYLADRFGDTLSVNRHGPTSLRQRFCLRHRTAWLSAIIFVGAADLFVISLGLGARALFLGAVIGTCALVYLAVNRKLPNVWRILPAKEVCIGVLFAAGMMVPLAAKLSAPMLPAWILFAGLCSMNCISIAVWERDLDLAQGRISIATVWPGIERWILAALLVIAAIGLAMGLVDLYLPVSAAMLGAVHYFRHRLEPNARTALADLVLMTPSLMVMRSLY